MVSSPPSTAVQNKKVSLVHASWVKISDQKMGYSAHFIAVVVIVKNGDDGEILCAAGSSKKLVTYLFWSIVGSLK
jgi:hypothetical protein